MWVRRFLAVRREIFVKPVQHHAKCIKPMPLMLFEINNNYCYAVDHSPQIEKKKEPLVERILKLLKESQKPMTIGDIRKELKGDYTKYKPAINYLAGEGLIKKIDGGYVEV